MKIVIPVIALSTLIASGVSAWSGSPSTGKLQIKMKIDEGCTVNPGGDAVLDFGEHGILTAASPAMTRETSIQVQCTSGVPYKIGLNAGLNPKEPGVTNLRQLKSANGNYISYFLRSPATKNVTSYVWGWGNNFYWDNMDPKGEPTVDGEGDGTPQSHPVIGGLVTGTLDRGGPPPGTYTDTVTVEVRF